MSRPRDDEWYDNVRARRNSLGADGQSGSGPFRTGRDGRIVLPSLPPAFPTSHSPAPTQNSVPYLKHSSSPGCNRFNVAPYDYPWHGNMPSQQQSSSFPYYEHYEHHDPRYGAPQYSAPRAPPSPPNDPHDSRRLSMPSESPARHEEYWPISQYTSHQMPQSYPAISSDYWNIDLPDICDQYSPIEPQYLADKVVVSRNKDARTYARSSAKLHSTRYSTNAVCTQTQEAIIKQTRTRRKPANAAQSNLLNETYRCTAFPTTEERNALAVQLDWTPRSVQIWFQNKRQADRQESRSLRPPEAPTYVGPAPSRESGLKSAIPDRHAINHVMQSETGYWQERFIGKDDWQFESFRKDR